MHRLARHLSLPLITGALCFGCCSGSNPCPNQQIGPSNGEVIGAIVGVVAIVGVGTAVAVHEEHKHHNITGCVLSGPDGLEIQDRGSRKRFLLAGATPSLKVGDLVKVHGNHVKAQRGSTSEQTFTVKDVKKSYGACPSTAPSANPTATP